MSHEGTSRRAIVTGALAGAAVIGLGASRVAAATRPASGGVAVTPLRSPDGCDAVTYVTGVNRAGQIVGHGLVGGQTFGPVLWSAGKVSAPAGPDGVRPLEIVGVSDLGTYAGTYDAADGRRTALLWTGGIPRPIRAGSLHTRAALMDPAGRVLVQARSTPPVAGAWTYDLMYLYDRGRATPVLPPGDGPWEDVRPVALNGRGGVVATVAHPDTYERLPFYWQAGRATWLTDVGGGGLDVRPVAVNDHGQVTGTVISNGASGYLRRAFRWQAGVSELSPLLPGETSGGVDAQGPQAINLSGDVVGSGNGESGATVPVLWSGGTVTVLPMPDDATLGQALAVNDVGDICGYTYSPAVGFHRPCVWRAGQRTDLPMPDGLLSAHATRIENDGRVFSSAGQSDEGVTTGGSITSGGSADGGGSDGGSSGGSSGGSTGGSTSGGSTSSGGSSSGGSSTDGGTSGSDTTGVSGEPGCTAAMYNSVQWTISA